MPYILQTPCHHEYCECFATLNSEDGVIAFQTRELAEQYAKDFMADPATGDTEVIVTFEHAKHHEPWLQDALKYDLE